MIKIHQAICNIISLCTLYHKIEYIILGAHDRDWILLPVPTAQMRISILRSIDVQTVTDKGKQYILQSQERYLIQSFESYIKRVHLLSTVTYNGFLRIGTHPSLKCTYLKGKHYRPSITSRTQKQQAQLSCLAFGPDIEFM